MLIWLNELTHTTVIFNKDVNYQLYIKAIKKEYTTGTDHRLPFLIKHLKIYTQFKWRKSINYDDLVRLTIAQLYWFTASRPCELLPTASEGTRGV